MRCIAYIFVDKAIYLSGLRVPQAVGWTHTDRAEVARAIAEQTRPESGGALFIESSLFKTGRNRSKPQSTIQLCTNCLAELAKIAAMTEVN